jgi:phospholipase/lecithinase/hemolysin
MKLFPSCPAPRVTSQHLLSAYSRAETTARRNGRSFARQTALLVVLLLSVSGLHAFAQAYTSIVVFGDSLCDTGNDAYQSRVKNTVAAQVPGIATGYTDGRFTDGMDTVPGARNYTGVWVEQLAAKLPAKPTINYSLNGGTNYAYGFATTDIGTTNFTYGPGNALSFTVNNMGQQITDYLATSPTINNKTLFIVWGGANDLINATSTNDIVAAATREVGLVQRLIAAGATDILVPNLPPLGLTPRFNGSATTSVPATSAAQGFNQALAAGLAQVTAATAKAGVRIFPLDTYTLFNAIVGPPIGYGFANVTASAQGNATVNPDTYLFWDNLHPTTYGHSLLAAYALSTINTPIATTTTLSSSNTNTNLKASVTLTATVTATGGTPIGTVTFTDGTTTLGTAAVSGSGSTATATYTSTALSSGSHNLVAAYTGVDGYANSVSTTLLQTVVAPSFSATAAPSSLTIGRGSSASTVVTVTPAGGYTGTFTLACGNVPAHFSCTIANPSLTISGTSPASTSILFNTNKVAVNAIPAKPGLSQTPVLSAVIGIPFLAGLAIFSRSRRKRSLPLALCFVALLGITFLGISGCSDHSDPFVNDTPAGSYSVPVTVTPSGGSATTLTINVVVQ